MPKPTKLLLFALMALATTAGPAVAQTATSPSPRTVYEDGHAERFLLDGTWHFRLDSEDRGLRSHFERQTSLEGWSPVTIPNAWNATDLSDRSARGSIGWYRRDFTLPASGAGASWILRFESVNYRATVFLNGREIGRHEGAYIPFEVPGRSMRKGANRLVIRVDNRRRRTDLPPAQDQQNGRPGGGWWNYGGILREVYLRRVRGIDIRNLLARPILPCASCDARVLLRARLANPGSRKKRVTVRASVGSVRTRFRSVVVKGRATRTVEKVVRIRNPRLWQPGDPQLYPVHASASYKGRPNANRFDTHIGIRSIRVSKGRLLLNGRQVQLRGASMHEDSPDNGMALTEQQVRDNMALLGELGATVTRAHYPLHPLTLEMCDRMGIMIWEQIPFNRGRFGNSAASTETPDDSVVRSEALRQKALGYIRAAIARDQNHAAVFTWSVANEPDPRPGASEREYFGKAVRLVHKLDPTRLAGVDLAGYPSVPQSDDYAQFDAIGLNSYFGWYQGPSGSLDDREGLRPFLRLMRDYYPRSALFMTEFGAESNREGPIDEKGTYAFQEELLGYHLDAYDQYSEFVNGAIVWILRDFRVQPGWDGGNPKPSPPVNTKGLVTAEGVRKPAFFEMARRWHDTPPFR